MEIDFFLLQNWAAFVEAVSGTPVWVTVNGPVIADCGVEKECLMPFELDILIKLKH